MFKRGISEEFVHALKSWDHWSKVVGDRQLFVGIRNEYINIYYQGCSIFKISYKESRLVLETHYKYLVRPKLKNPLIPWDDGRPAIGARADEILLREFELRSLKSSASNFAGAEKEGVQCVLESNKNVVDVEVAISPESEDEGQEPQGRRIADRIDFAAIQRKGGKARIVFFEAKRFDNAGLRSQNSDPPVMRQIRKYEAFIEQYRPALEKSYRRVCKNLVDLVPASRLDAVLKEAASRPDQLAVDPAVRLVVFSYDKDQEEGRVWNKHKMVLSNHFKERLLLKGNPRGFTRGISK